MAINLSKGQKISLEKNDGSSLNNFCVGVNWGAIESKGGFFRLGKKLIDVDLDLSCIIVGENKEMVDYIYSPFYNMDFLTRFGLQKGKLETKDRALKHSGDDLQGDDSADDDDNEIISVDLSKVTPLAKEIFFFLNNVGKEDFSEIPYTKLRMFEGTQTKVKEVFASYNVSSEEKYKNKRALVLGKLTKDNGKWAFSAIGDATSDIALGETIKRILTQY